MALRIWRVVVGLELVRVLLKQCFQIGDAEQACTGVEDIVERHGAEHDVASGAATVDEESVGVGIAAAGEVPCARNAIADIDHAGLPVEALAIGSPVPRAAAVVDIEICKPATRPE